MVEIQEVGAKVKPRLGFSCCEVKGIVFIHNFSYNHLFLLKFISA